MLSVNIALICISQRCTVTLLHRYKCIMSLIPSNADTYYILQEYDMSLHLQMFRVLFLNLCHKVYVYEKDILAPFRFSTRTTLVPKSTTLVANIRQ